MSKAQKNDKMVALRKALAVFQFQSCYVSHAHKLAQHQEVQHFVNRAAARSLPLRCRNLAAFQGTQVGVLDQSSGSLSADLGN